MRLIIAVFLILFSCSGWGMSRELVDRLNKEINEDEMISDAFMTSRTSTSMYPTPERWFLYGRIGPLNFQNRLGEVTDSGTQFQFRKTGPKLTGKIYIGIRKQF